MGAADQQHQHRYDDQDAERGVDLRETVDRVRRVAYTSPPNAAESGPALYALRARYAAQPAAISRPIEITSRRGTPRRSGRAPPGTETGWRPAASSSAGHRRAHELLLTPERDRAAFLDRAHLEEANVEERIEAVGIADEGPPFEQAQARNRATPQSANTSRSTRSTRPWTPAPGAVPVDDAGRPGAEGAPGRIVGRVLCSC